MPRIRAILQHVTINSIVKIYWDKLAQKRHTVCFKRNAHLIVIFWWTSQGEDCQYVHDEVLYTSSWLHQLGRAVMHGIRSCLAISKVHLENAWKVCDQWIKWHIVIVEMIRITPFCPPPSRVIEPQKIGINCAFLVTKTVHSSIYWHVLSCLLLDSFGIIMLLKVLSHCHLWI